MLGDTRAGEVSSDQTFKHLGETSSACGGQARQPGGKTWSGHTHPHPHTPHKKGADAVFWKCV